jgi:hypothetical protein
MRNETIAVYKSEPAKAAAVKVGFFANVPSLGKIAGSSYPTRGLAGVGDNWQDAVLQTK